MAKTTTAPASAAKTTTSKTITKTKKVHHPWKGQNVAFVGPFIYQETKERTVIMLEDEDSIKPLVNKMGAKFAGHSLAKTTRVVVIGDSERMSKGEENPMLKKVMKARDARASDEASPLLVCSFTTFLAEYSTPYNLEPALHRCLTSLEFHKMENPTELGKRDAKSLTDAVSGKTKGKTKGKLAVKYNHQKHSNAAQHNLTNRRIEAAGDEPEQEDSKEDDGAEDVEAPTSAMEEPMPEDAKEEGSPAAEEPGAQDPDDKADEAVASQR